MNWLKSTGPGEIAPISRDFQSLPESRSPCNYLKMGYLAGVRSSRRVWHQSCIILGVS
jgi:hypothetical protein